MKPGRKYFWSTLVIAAVVTPLLLQLPVVFTLLTGFSSTLVTIALACIIFLGGMIPLWLRRAGNGNLPDSALARWLPLLIPFAWYMLAFIIPFGLGGYRFGNQAFQTVVGVAGIPWFAINFLLAFMGDFTLYPIAVTGLYTVAAVIFAIGLRVHRRGPGTGGRRALALLGAALVVCGICGWQFHDRSRKVLGSDYSTLRVEDEVDLWAYVPFREGNQLAVPEAVPTLAIASAYPRLDGATAAYPVYAAMAQAVYKGLDESTIERYVSCTTTPEAYARLIAGEIDIFFGAQPSQGQEQAAAQAGLTFYKTPIAREAFVLFVNAENTVEGLSTGQIQDIYQKKLTSWRQVGGPREAIQPFQRPEGSGSQTIMVRFMGDKALPTPLIEERAAGMGGVISGVADYRNYAGAIGYSFRYFATAMKGSEGIRLLAVDGVAPTAENIRSGSYPMTVEVYAVTTGEPEGNVKALIDWVLSAEGQALIEQSGYVGR